MKKILIIPIVIFSVLHSIPEITLHESAGQIECAENEHLPMKVLEWVSDNQKELCIGLAAAVAYKGIIVPIQSVKNRIDHIRNIERAMCRRNQPQEMYAINSTRAETIENCVNSLKRDIAKVAISGTGIAVGLIALYAMQN